MGSKKIVEFSTKCNTSPPPQVSGEKNDHVSNSVCYGSSDTCQMASFKEHLSSSRPLDQQRSFSFNGKSAVADSTTPP